LRVRRRIDPLINRGSAVVDINFDAAFVKE
jgi:hypothetical protein